MDRIHTRRKVVTISLILFVSIFIQSINCSITIDTQDVTLDLDQKTVVHIIVANYKEKTPPEVLMLIPQHPDIVQVSPSNITLDAANLPPQPITITGVGAGHSEISANISHNAIDGVFMRVTVRKLEALDELSLVIGWVYFIAWSVSFYPQIYINWKRKSVVGLNFDFLALNVVGFSLYSLFNLGLYFIPEIQDEYFARYPRGLNPVQVNDIVFAVHAALASLLTIWQCFLYEKDEQRVSITARSILTVFALFLVISAILAGTAVLHWLDFLYYCSYVKLTITLIKYVPQAYMNYKRKSTVGWSIGNIFLDFTGGILSMLQMIVLAYNYDDWRSIFGDPTKFGLGLFSVMFDIFFIIQHYVLYRHTNYEVR